MSKFPHAGRARRRRLEGGTPGEDEGSPRPQTRDRERRTGPSGRARQGSADPRQVRGRPPIPPQVGRLTGLSRADGASRSKPDTAPASVNHSPCVRSRARSRGFMTSGDRPCCLAGGETTGLVHRLSSSGIAHRRPPCRAGEVCPPMTPLHPGLLLRWGLLRVERLRSRRRRRVGALAAGLRRSHLLHECVPVHCAPSHHCSTPGGSSVLWVPTRSRTH